MEIVADLHMHSTCSDGEYPPDIIVEKVIKDGLSTFALSDHDTIDHIPKITDYIKNKNSVGLFGIDTNSLNNFTQLLI